jgi:hypothetical protein
MSERRRIGRVLMLSLSLAAVQAAAGEAAHHHHGHDHETATARDWTEQPRLVKARGFNRSMTLLRPVGLRIDSATVLPSVAADAPPQHQVVPLREGKLAVRTVGPRQGGYYRIAAMQPTETGARIAGTVLYFSNPGPSPRAMLAQPAMPLEIVPASLPREHRHYRAGETWSFLLRGEGRPLADHPVLFETARGTRLSLSSDAQGRVEVPFPDDLPEVAEEAGHGGHRRGPSSAFVLSAQWRTPAGRELSTAFNHEYRAAAYAGKSLWLGSGFALLGMLAATPLLRKRREGAS